MRDVGLIFLLDLIYSKLFSIYSESLDSIFRFNLFFIKLTDVAHEFICKIYLGTPGYALNPFSTLVVRPYFMMDLWLKWVV